ncbi:MAG: ATPase, partial [Myxococcota bacterium]
MSTTDSAKGPTAKAMQEIDLLVRSRYPIIYLLTHEEARLEYLLFRLASDQGKQFLTWSSTRGLNRVTTADSDEVVPKGDFQDPAEALRNIQSRNDSGLFMLKDFHTYLEDPQIIRLLRDVACDLKGTYKNILITAPRLVLPVELDKEISVIDFPLPDRHELAELLKMVCRAVAQKNRAAVQLTTADAQAMVQAALGLTLSEAENAFAKAAVTDGIIQSNDI